MITRSMIVRGYENGVVRLIPSPHEDGIVCAIVNDEHWFYFSSFAAEETDSVAELQTNISKDTIIDEIFETLDDMKDYEEFCDEYDLYEYALTAYGCKTLLEGYFDETLDAVAEAFRETGLPAQLETRFLSLVMRKFDEQIGKEVITSKIWTKEDIRDFLEDSDHSDLANDVALINKIAADGILVKDLEVCTHDDWVAFSDAVDRATK